MRHVLAAIALTAVAGCSLLAPAPTPSRAPVPAPLPAPSPAPLPTPAPAEPPATPLPTPAPAPSPPVRTFRLGAAAQSLVAQSHAQVANNDLDGAAGTLDRAIRIEPRNPLLWIELAKVRLAQKEARQAEGYGRKALALATGDRHAQSLASKVIADSLRAQGRTQEAQAFDDRAKG
jgi:tetratricopeptide (TPR) repeat protein